MERHAQQYGVCGVAFHLPWMLGVFFSAADIARAVSTIEYTI